MALTGALGQPTTPHPSHPLSQAPTASLDGRKAKLREVGWLPQGHTATVLAEARVQVT